MREENNIPKGWVETTLGEVSLRKQYGYTESASLEIVGPKFLRITDIQNDFISWDTVPYCPISESDYAKYKLEVGDIVIARTGNSTGATATIKENVDAVFASYLIRFQLKKEKADYRFIDFLVRSKNWYDFVNSVKSGSAQGGANANDFASFPINLPPHNEQQAIASILTTFDDKIELLQAQNETLEATAQTIFKEWFGKYQVEDELPEGWRVGELNDLVDFVVDNRGKTPPLTIDDLESFPLVEVNSITGDDRNVSLDLVKKFVDKETYESWFRKGHPINGDVLLSTVGSIGQLAQVFDEKICIAQNIIALRSNVSGNFLYELLKNNQDLIISLDISSVQPSIKVPHLLNLDVVIPNHELIRDFDRVADNFTKKMMSNKLQIQTLQQTRDTLLPKLMSGELRVEGFKD